MIWALAMTLLWLCFCNYRTACQRRKVLQWCQATGNWLPLQKVTYNSHFFHLFTFRNPYKLYISFLG